jgi:hypothetical protein
MKSYWLLKEVGYIVTIDFKGLKMFPIPSRILRYITCATEKASLNKLRHFSGNLWNYYTG